MLCGARGRQNTRVQRGQPSHLLLRVETVFIRKLVINWPLQTTALRGCQFEMISLAKMGTLLKKRNSDRDVTSLERL